MRVLVRESIADAGVELLRSKFEVDEDQTTPIAEIIDRYDAIVIRSATKLTADVTMVVSTVKAITSVRVERPRNSAKRFSGSTEAAAKFIAFTGPRTTPPRPCRRRRTS